MKAKHLAVTAVITVLAAVNAVTIAMVWQASRPKHVIAELYPSDQLVKHIQR